MTLRPLLLAAAAGLAAATAATAAPAPVATVAATKITANGVGKVKLGAPYARLHEAGLLGRLRSGCPLSGPGARVARLRAPLRGEVDLGLGKARRVRAITVTGGATARGVGIGDTVQDILAAFPKAKVDHSLEDTFAATFVRVPKAGGGRMTFLLPTDKQKITQIGVPVIPICE